MGGESPAGAVFLSYASQDAEAAQRICEALRAAGIEVWFDQSELRGGDAWDRQIRKQIHDCALFVPIISANTDERTEGYFRLEWKLAVDRSHLMADDAAFLLPVVIDGTPDATARVPDKFREVQWSRLPHGETPAAFVERVARLLSPPKPHAPGQAKPLTGPASAAAIVPPQPVSSPGAARRTQSMLVLLGLAAVFGVGYLAVDKLWLSKRPASARQASATLAQPVVTSPGAIPEKSIAVLPFIDMSEKKDQEYFSDGLTEELLDLLAKVPDLRVPARTSSFSFKGKADDISAIAQKLRVAHVLEGSVRKAGNTIRVTAQLIRADNGYHLWSETYDRDIKDIFKVQDEIAAAVVSALKLRLVGALPPERAATENPVAHRLLLEGRFFEERNGAGDSERAISSYERALQEDRRYALAWAELAWALLWQIPLDYARASPASQAALNAIELQPDLALAHATRGWYESLYGYDWAAASTEFNKALALEPQNMRALFGKGRLARVLHRNVESIRYYEAARERDPVSRGPTQGLSTTLVATGRTAEAVQFARRALDISPNILEGHWRLAHALLWNGELEAALSEIQLEPMSSWRLSYVALIEQARRHTGAADAALRQLLASDGPNKEYLIASVYAARGDAKSAVAWLERGRLARSPYIGEVNGNPAFNPIRRNSEFVAFLRKMNLPE